VDAVGLTSATPVQGSDIAIEVAGDGVVLNGSANLDATDAHPRGFAQTIRSSLNESSPNFTEIVTLRGRCDGSRNAPGSLLMLASPSSDLFSEALATPQKFLSRYSAITHTLC
jgi:hypothetical protein